MSLARTAIGSIWWSMVENGSLTAISFAALIIFAKLLDPSDFGTYAIAVSVIEIAGIFTNMLFHDALVREPKASDAHFNAAFTVSVVVSVAIFGILLIIFPLLAALVGDSRIGDVGRVLGVGLLFEAPTSILNARLRKEFGFRLLAIRTLIGRTAGAAVGILAALHGYGVWSLVIQSLLMTILGSATLVMLTAWRPRLTRELRPLADVLNYSVGAVTSLATSFATKRAFIFFAGVFLGAEKVGFLNLAFRLVDTVWAISATAISQVMLPLMSRLQHDRERLLRSYRIALAVGCTLIYPIFVGIGCEASELISVIFGTKWLPAAEPALWLSLLVFVQAPRLFMTSLLSALGKIESVRSVNLAVLAYMAIAIALTRLSDTNYALAVWSGSECLALILLTLSTYRKCAFSPYEHLRILSAPAIASALMAVAISLTRQFLPNIEPGLAIAVLSVVGFVIYAGLSVVLARSSLVLAVELWRSHRQQSPTENS
ncbi:MULTISPECIES: lipopolysaccharide biosynthesis protein [unclassified Bradyrhizobium]|uniref:lipopolysaccharide biosynthesis protein n=1 Tax=unclassified Bradyrhizobium TaxID=2631580 RepID=UPI001CD2E86B|nr:MULTISPECIES: lipopolysaccharide biosynthesis protein [unclassified Bradyrhizobium]MCA1426787.1 lipopolysaccharide biosynthesis protein [Bradyrhizobium sp. NBAIM16]MCA1505574.1 lipopolysaccharide biosynthesis protein [Bradyrhizobium sp. NBAIM02]